MPPATGKTSFFKTVGNALGSTCGTIMGPVRVYTTNKEVSAEAPLTERLSASRTKA